MLVFYSGSTRPSIILSRDDGSLRSGTLIVIGYSRFPKGSALSLIGAGDSYPLLVQGAQPLH